MLAGCGAGAVDEGCVAEDGWLLCEGADGFRLLTELVTTMANGFIVESLIPPGNVQKCSLSS